MESSPPLSAAPSRSLDPYGITIGTLADDVLAKRGKAKEIIRLPNDEFGLVVSWVYSDATYTMAHRTRDGVTAYRVIDIR